MMTVAALGCMVGLTGIMVGYPGVFQAGAIILVVAACIDAASVIAVNIPSRNPRRRCRRDRHCP